MTPKQPEDLRDQLINKLPLQVFQALEENLVFGSVFMIPDEISGLASVKRKKGKTREHPFVVIRYNKGTNQLVICALRTSNTKRRGVYTPANVLPSLDKPGVIVLDEPFKIEVHKFLGLSHIGILPEQYRSQLKARIIWEGWL